MNTPKTNKKIFVSVFSRYSRVEMLQMSIILAFILFSILLSIWLPIYIVQSSLAGG